MNDGWISLYRQIQDHWLWQDSEPFDKRSAWIDLLLLANHKEVKAMKGDKVITFKPGTVNRSIESLAQRWKWSRSKASRFLAALESDGMVRVLRSTNGATISIVKYSDFQNQRSTQRSTHERLMVQHADTNNNDNNVNNIYTPDGDTLTEDKTEVRESYSADPGRVDDLVTQALQRLGGRNG